MRILVVEDDSHTAQAIELILKGEGHSVYSTDLGEEAIDLAKLYDYDLVLLDLVLPDMHGMQVIQTLRSGNVNTPILVVTGTHDIDMKIKCLHSGADDYMTKPFNQDELLARVSALVRRHKGHDKSTIKTGEIEVNVDAHTTEVNGQRVHLTGKEQSMLELLSLRKNTVISKEMFLNHLYGGMDEPELKIIDVFIVKLRKKLAAATGGEHYIETVWGRGYTLRDSGSHDHSIDQAPPAEPAATSAPLTSDDGIVGPSNPQPKRSFTGTLGRMLGWRRD